jgi:hypothetical protein
MAATGPSPPSPEPEVENPHHPLAAAYAHSPNISLGNDCEVPFIQFCYHCIGLLQLLPDTNQTIASDTSEKYIDVRLSTQPEADSDMLPLAAETNRQDDWFGNEAANCESMTDWATSLEDVKIWNWGNSTDISTTGGNAEGPEVPVPVGEQQHRTPAAKRPTPWTVAESLGPGSDHSWSLAIHDSLLTALKFALFGDRFDVSSSIPESILFNKLDRIANEYMRYIILRLSDENLFKTGRPISHVFVDVIACVKVLKALIKSEDPSNEGIERTRFCTDRKEFWKINLGFPALIFKLD